MDCIVHGVAKVGHNSETFTFQYVRFYRYPLLFCFLLFLDCNSFYSEA